MIGTGLFIGIAEPLQRRAGGTLLAYLLKPEPLCWRR